MKRIQVRRMLAMLLALAMLVCFAPATAFAAEADSTETTGGEDTSAVAEVTSDGSFVSETHEVFSRTQSTIAPGVTQDIVYAYAKDGKQMVYYVATADINRSDVAVYANYRDNQCTTFGMAKLTDQMATAQERNTTDTTAPYYNPYYTVVAGVNGDFYNMTTGRPSGAFVMEGTVVNASNNRPFFAIRQDGTPVIGYGTADWNTYNAESAIVEAVGGSQVLVFNGKDVTANASGSYNTDRHCRTCVGITADGKIVLMSLDGRQEPFSCGGTMHELAQIMLEAGCVSAINLDGGGSTTFAARQEGENEVSIVNRPSDGSERAISSSLIVVSTAAPSNVFERAVLTAENSYVTPGSSVKLSATGVSPAGTAAEIPDNAVWNATLGTVDNGVFTSDGTAGDAKVQLLVDGSVVGETTIHVVIPESVSFVYSELAVPYGKSVELQMKATVNGGLNAVALKEGDFCFVLSDAALGSVEGSVFTACGEESGLNYGKITAAFVYDENLTAEASLVFGKGSTVVYDFEDGSTEGFTIKSGYFNKAPKFGRWGKGSFEIITAEAGKVKNGQKALAVELDYSQFNSMGWKSVALSGLNVDLTDAIAVGMWIYIPKEAIGMTELDLNNSVILDSYVSEVQADGFEGGWFYVSTTDIADLDNNLSSIYFYQNDGYDNGSDANIMTKFTVYIDDITVDYSSAVDDRVAPKYEYVRVSYGGLSDAENLNGQTITDNVVSVTARITDDRALNLSGVYVLVDGVKLTADSYTVADTGIVTTKDLTLADGVHTFTFVASDMMGNESAVTRSMTVNAGSGIPTVKLVPKALADAPVYIGSVQWFDLVATDIEKISSIDAVLDLDTSSKWQLANMVVEDGFEVSYTINSDTNDATLRITKTGDVVLSGEAVVVSLPVRTWEHTSHLDYPDQVYTGCSTGDSDAANSPHTLWKSDAICNIDIILKVEAGSAYYTDSGSVTFSSEEYHVDTELNFHRSQKNNANVAAVIDASYSYHIHQVSAPEDKAPTCTEPGYTGRTFCIGCICDDEPHVASEAKCNHTGCDSVVDWGTALPATGHSYTVADGALKCSCGEMFNGELDGKMYVDGLAAAGWVGDSYYADGVMLTGLQIIDGFYYNLGEAGICEGQTKFTGMIESEDGLRYARFGELVTGWILVGDNNYYFGEDYFAVGGTDVRIEGYIYSFNADYTLAKGMWTKDSQGRIRYVWAGLPASKEMREIEGNTYFFDASGFLLTGDQYVRWTHGSPYTMYYIGDDGVVQGEMTGFNGLHKSSAGVFMVENGEATYAGLVKDSEGNYYYINSSRKAVVNTSYSISETMTNGLLPAGRYNFDAEGKMIDPPVVEDPDVPTPDVKQGLVFDEDGEIRYYVDGVAQYAGVVQDAEGNYYYINSSKKAVKNTGYTIGDAKTNGLVPAGRYTFGTDGKMLDAPGTQPENPDVPTPDVKQGLVFDEDGEIRYYVDGVAQYAGVVQDAEGNYYYINSSKKAVKNTGYTIGDAKTNGLVPAGRYTFGADGKMLDAPGTQPEEPDVPTPDVKQGLVFDEDGEIRYYVDGVAQYAGVVQDAEGNYYYINSSKKAVKNTGYNIGATKTNGLIPAGRYTFGADGKMIDPSV